MRLVTGAQMAEIDRRTIHDFGLDGQVLMEVAGRSLAEWLGRHCPTGARVAFLCGPGNNGGDALVAARAWADLGGEAECFLLGQEYRGDAALNLERARRWKLPLRPWEEVPSDWARYSWVVDGLFGTGLSRALGDDLARVIESLPGERTLAIDIPSGVHSATGQVLGKAVRAVATLTFGLPKLGQLLPPGNQYCGCLEVVPIGFPRSLTESDEWPGQWITSDWCRRHLPRRGWDTHKGKSGRVLVVAGSSRYPGAAVLATLGALRAGAGLVYTLAPARVLEAVMHHAPEAIPLCTSHPDHWTLADQSHLQAGYDVALVGPGLGQHEEVARASRALLESFSGPMVVDADGLRTLSEGSLALSPRVLLTPHVGELSRLTRLRAPEIEADRLQAALKAARNYRCCVLLKGASTLVTTPGGSFLLSNQGTPVLAQGGSGDVLAGVAAALIGQGLAALEAGGLAAELHGRASRLAEVPAGLGARALCEWIPRAWKQLCD